MTQWELGSARPVHSEGESLGMRGEKRLGRKGDPQTGFIGGSVTGCEQSEDTPTGVNSSDVRNE